jgi:hypothetical protein
MTLSLALASRETTMQLTLVNTQNYVLHPTIPAQEVLPPNPRRKAFLLTPLAGGGASLSPLVAVVFGPGASQPWVVPAGVTQVVDMYVWGAGGNPGAPGAVLGGGGGGGGGYAAPGPLTVTPGSIYLITVDAAGGAVESNVVNTAGTKIARAISGGNGLLDVGGTGGSGSLAAVKFAGGAGATATALAGLGGGGGGAGGNPAAGGAGVAGAGGAGGGGPVLGGNGAGGSGGAGGLATLVGLVGATPGGGGGGSGNNGPAAPGGANGVGIVFYVPALAAQAISLSPRSDVAVGAGAINWLPGSAAIALLTDRNVGRGIAEPWYAISGVDGVVIQVTEWMYEQDVPPSYS